ncbi:MAG: DUF502 domain-containing protein [Gammaproteobacteria bacterium]|nr:DUF502 domain-containing protein [Gammaproteobacteria bacterium]
MIRSISKNILTGLITILPVVLTLYLFYWLVVSTESLLGAMLRFALPDGLYRPGMGVVAGLVVAFSAGLLMHALVVQRLFGLAERLFSRLPLIKSVYFAIRDFLDYFSPARKKEFGQVVAVTLGDAGMQLVGFVTQSDATQLPKEFRQQDSVLVYLPMSYMIGGYAVVVPRSAVRPLDMPIEDAMRFVLTAGVTGEHSARVWSK